MAVHTHTCILRHTHTDTDTHTHTQTETHAHTDTETHTMTLRNTHTQIHVHTDRHRHTHWHWDTYTYTCTHTQSILKPMQAYIRHLCIPYIKSWRHARMRVRTHTHTHMPLLSHYVSLCVTSATAWDPPLLQDTTLPLQEAPQDTHSPGVRGVELTSPLLTVHSGATCSGKVTRSHSFPMTE